MKVTLLELVKIVINTANFVYYHHHGDISTGDVWSFASLKAQILGNPSPSIEIEIKVKSKMS